MNPRLEVISAIIAYSCCSGTLVLLNKLTLHHLPYPSLVVAVQLAFALCFIYGAKFTKLLTVDEIQWKHVVPYLYYMVLFSVGVYCNMKSLSISNVETVIVFRALTPCVVSFLDALFLGREWPTIRSWSGLGLIVLGAYLYATYDEKFQTQGMMAYFWPTLYLFDISLEMAYGKKIIRSVDLKTLSGPVLYTNLLGLPSMLMFAVLAGEPGKYSADRAASKPITAAAIVFLMLGCIVGTGIGYTGWWCRDKISATSFTLVGVINKDLTVSLNLMIWDQHAPMGGLLSLLICLVGGAVYKQAPMREDFVKQEDIHTEDDENTDLEKFLRDEDKPETETGR
jgi:drug/metabolite transporter (DMT)-like permease